MVEYEGVMIMCEVKEGNLVPITTELLGGGRKLADDLGQELGAVLIGSGIRALAQEALFYGADKVYVADDPMLADYQADAYIQAMEWIIKQRPPEILLLGQTAIGRELAPRLAFRLNTAASLGCVDLKIEPESKRLLQTK